MELGEVLTRLRMQKGLYQKELAAYLNVTVSTVSNYENGTHSPDLHTLEKIADFYGTSTDYLLQRTNLKYDISILNKSLTDDYTVGDLVNVILELDSDNARSFVDYIELLRIRNSILRDH